MKDSSNRYLKKLINIGTNENQSYEERHRIRYVNQMNTIGVIGSLFFAIIDYFYELYWCSFIMVIMTLIVSASFILMSRGKTNLSPIISILTCASASIIISYQIKADISLEYILFVLVPLPTIAIERKKTYLTTALMVSLLLCGGFILIEDFSRFGIYTLSPYEAKILRIMIFTQASFLMIFQVKVNNKEIENRYNQYLDNYSKIENQTRLSDLGRLYAGIAHEINNPLAIIKSAASYCLKRFKNGSITTERVETELIRINKHVERVVLIVQGLKHISRDASGDAFQKVSINHILQSVIDLCSFKLKEKEIEYNAQLLQPEIEVFVNEIQIEQVLFSIISNAIDALEDQDVREIKLTVKENPSDLLISIKDNGPGIPLKIQNDIFKPFFTTKPLGKGTGLGLSIAFEVIQNHNGLLTVESTEKGTTFFIRLPKVNKKD